MNTWIYSSQDFDNISLHDMIIDNIEVINDNIYFHLEDGFAISKNHKENKSGKHLQTGKSAIILFEGKFLRANNFYLKEEISKHDLYQSEIEILEFESANNNLHILYENEKCDFCECFFQFSTIAYYWNEYCEYAWFEG